MTASTANPAPMATPEDSLLGKPASYTDRYEPALLFPLPRAAR